LRLPFQAPPALQLVASVDDQLSVVLSPPLMVDDARVRSTWGASTGAAVTSTVTESDTLPPGPVQLRTNVLVLFSAPLEADPDRDLLPDQALLALQAVALLLDQFSVTGSPSTTEFAEAFSVTVGACGWVTCTLTESLRLPPGPVQVRV
jgi:hypothetical protein